MMNIKNISNKIPRRMKRVLKKVLYGENNSKELHTSENAELQQLDEVRKLYAGVDRDHVWAFISGQASQDFRGNPKYMFVYINKYRPDIKAYWLCEEDETIEQVRKLGFQAYKQSTAVAQYVINRTGVLVAEQVKYSMPEGFFDVKYINLWHGVGFKKVERALHLGDISMELARKYVMRGTYYRDYQLMNASCPVIEKEYTNDCGIDPDKFLRTGYPRCLYQKNFDPIVTYEHDLKKVKGLTNDAKLVVYAPTYRANLGGTFSKAIPDFDKLYDFCEKNNILFVFKVHPNMEKEVGFLKAWEKYGDKKHFWFWDNRDDFYEIMHMMDLAIVDYSGIISDMIAMGIKHYIRYIFDYEEYMSTVSIHDNYLEKTTGKKCFSFEELLSAMSDFESRDESAEIARLNEELWSYSKGSEDFERIIQTAMEFEVCKREFPILYSFDIFDTVLSRKVLEPKGIFYLIMEKLREDGSFPYAFERNYPLIRHTAEFNMREYYAKTKVLRDSESTEVSFDEIFERISSVYNLSEEQIDKLKKWELEAELDNVIPLPEQINLIKELIADDQKVVLISDMYLPKEQIEKMLYKADPILAELPLFLSNEYGVLKTSQKLYFEVYKSFEPYYDFEKWIHYGDNDNADKIQARRFKISTRKVNRPDYNQIQKQLVDYLGTYDSHLVAGMQARMCQENPNESDEFVISYLALIFVPYIDWVLRDAQRRGYETLYFISRDGHHLKRIADAIIKERGLKFKTKYIYASRRTWRIPSFVHEVDQGFWEPYGSFNEIESKSKLLSAMNIDEEGFKEYFPYIDLDNVDFRDKKEVKSLVEIFKNSKGYNEYLMNCAKEERKIVNGYLKQEINPDEKFAFVEYYGRGYTQDCLVNLWRDAVKDETVDIVFYYSRSVLPTMNGAIRHNFTTNDAKQYFIESIFANMPYKSVQEYKMNGDVIEPVIVPIPYNKKMFDSMNRILPEFAKRYAELPLLHPEDTDRLLYDFVFKYYSDNTKNVKFAEKIGTLIDSVSLYGNKRELAPAYTMENLELFEEKKIGKASMMITSNPEMSFVRSDVEVQERFKEMYQILPEDTEIEGRLLSENERVENRKYKKMYEALEKRAKQFGEFYKKCILDVEVEEKIVLLDEGKSVANTGLDLLEEELEKQNKYQVKTITLKKYPQKNDEKLAQELATAKFIVVSNPIGLLCKTSLRNETKEIFLPKLPFVLYNKGAASQMFLKWRRKYLTLAGENDISVMQIPSKDREEFFRTNYNSSGRSDCELLGNCQTDLYYDKAYIDAAKSKLEEMFPAAKDKKCILYMPTWRTRSDCDTWLNMLDLEVLQELIGKEYVVIVNINKSQIKNPTLNTIEIPGFSKEISKGMSVRELMIACDIIVGDYRDTFFESAIMHKPVYFTAYDYETVMQSASLSQNANHFEEYIFGPVIRNAYEFAKELNNLDSYDYTKMEGFKNKMFAGCDGHSTGRVVEYLLNESV